LRVAPWQRYGSNSAKLSVKGHDNNKNSGKGMTPKPKHRMVNKQRPLPAAETAASPERCDRRMERTVKRAKDTILVLCLFVVYCVLLSEGLKANTVSAFFGALAAVPLTVHLYRRLWPVPVEKDAGERSPRNVGEAEPGVAPGRDNGRAG
jgi:hypothetical protein